MLPDWTQSLAYLGIAAASLVWSHYPGRKPAAENAG